MLPPKRVSSTGSGATGGAAVWTAALLLVLAAAAGATPSEEPAALAAVIKAATEEWRFADALDAASRQLDARLRQSGPRDSLVIDAHLAIGRVMAGVDRYRAREQLEYTWKLLGETGDEESPAAAAVLLAMASLDTGPEGARCRAEARRILLRNDAQGTLAWADLRHAEGRAAWRRGRLAEAEQGYRDAAEIQRTRLGPHDPAVASTLIWLAHIVEEQDRLDDASAILQSALDAGPSPALLATARAWLAMDAASRGDFARADSLYARASRWLLDQRLSGQADFAPRRSDFGLRDLAALRLTEGRSDDAWKILETARTWTTGAFASLGRQGSGAGSPRLGRLGERILDLELRLHERPEAHLARAALWRAEADRLLLERDALRRAGLSADDPLGELQRSLLPTEAVLGWCEMRFRSTPGDSGGRYARWAHVIRDHGPVEWIPLGRWDEPAGFQHVHDSLASLHRMIERAAAWPTRARTDPRLERLAALVSEELLDPVMPRLDGIDHLVVEIPGGWKCPPLGCLPLPDGRDLLDRFSVSYTTSAALFTALRGSESDRAGRSRPSLVIGDALYATPSPVGGDPWSHLEAPSGSALDLAIVRSAASGDESSLDLLPGLPFSRYEAEHVSALLPRATLLTGPDASEDRLDDLRRSGELSAFDVIHVAAHALAADIPERNALALSRPALAAPAGGAHGDGLITAREILVGWSLSARLVTLSGCQTAGAGGTLDGPYGFRQALLKAGARTIVDAQWKVEDVATALLMERFYANLASDVDDEKARGGAAARALADAKRWLRDLETPDGRHPFEHPAYWSGFVLFGSPD